MENEKTELQKKIEELEEAKKNTLFCLNHSDGLAGMHGLAYWAGVVERLREEIKHNL